MSFLIIFVKPFPGRLRHFMLSLSSKKSTIKSKEANADIEDPAVAEEKWDKRNKQQSRVPYFYSPPKKIPAPKMKKSKVCMYHWKR